VLGFVVDACIFCRLYYTVLLITSIHYFKKNTQQSLLQIKINISHVKSTEVPWLPGMYGGRGGPNCRGMRATEGKLRAVGNIQKHESSLHKIFKAGILLWVSPFLQATKALRESRRIALLCFLDLGIRRGWGVSVTPWPLSTPRKDPVPIVQEAGWAPGPVWTGAENLAPTGIQSPDRPARSQSLYPLSYPAHWKYCYVLLKRTYLNVNNNDNSNLICTH
jgi:hypothetical protein